MNAARNRHAADLVLRLSQQTTDELERALLARNPSRPSRYLHPLAYRHAVEHVLAVRRMLETGTRRVR